MFITGQFHLAFQTFPQDLVSGNFAIAKHHVGLGSAPPWLSFQGSSRGWYFAGCGGF